MFLFIACPKNTYGRECQSCPENCKDSECDKFSDDVNCTYGCAPGYTDNMCQNGGSYCPTPI